MRKVALATLLPCAILLGSCEYAPTTVERTISYNHAIAESTNELLFLNAIRSSKREPTYYTRNAGNNTTSTVAPALSLIDPLGKNVSLAPTMSTVAGASASMTTGATTTLADMAKSLTPSVTLTETNQLQLLNLDDQGSVTGLMSSVPSAMLAQYIKEGWNREELLLLFMNDVELSAPLLSALPDAVAENCATTMIEASPGDEPSPYCGYFFPQEMRSSVSPSCVAMAKNIDPSKKTNPPAGWSDCVDEFKRLNVWPIWYKVPEKKDATDQSSAKDVTAAAAPKPLQVNLGWKFAQAVGEADGSGPQSNFDFSCFPKAAIMKVASAEMPTAADIPNFGKPKKPVAVAAAAAPPVAVSHNGYHRHHHKASNAAQSDDDDSDDVQTMTVVNDPALDRASSGDKSMAPHDFACYKQVVRAMLALDLDLDTGTSRKALFVVSHGDIKNNPRLLADLAQQGLELAAMSPKTPKGGLPDIGVCKKTDSLGFKLEGDSYVKEILGLGPSPKPTSRTAGNDTFKDSAQITSSNYSLGFNLRSGAPERKKPKTTDCAVAAQKWEQAAPDDSTDSNTVTFTPRSLEGMVYYVGQVIRRSVDENKPDGVSFFNSADPAGAYEEKLFAVSTGVPSFDNFVNITHERTIYYVPSICDADVGSGGRAEPCTTEFPNHAGPQVLTLLGQIWGLEKTATTLPPVPTVTLINP